MTITNEERNELVRLYTEENVSLRKQLAETYEAMIYAQNELADLRAYKERTEAGLGAKPRGWAQLRDALERREKAAKSEDNRACWWWALKEMDAIEAMFSKANPPQAEVQP